MPQRACRFDAKDFRQSYVLRKDMMRRRHDDDDALRYASAYMPPARRYAFDACRCMMRAMLRRAQRACDDDAIFALMAIAPCRFTIYYGRHLRRCLMRHCRREPLMLCCGAPCRRRARRYAPPRFRDDRRCFEMIHDMLPDASAAMRLMRQCAA